MTKNKKHTPREEKAILLFCIILFWAITGIICYGSLFKNGYLQIGTMIIASFFFLIGGFSLVVLLRYDYFKSKEKTPGEGIKVYKPWKIFWSALVIIVFGCWGIVLLFNSSKTVEENEVVEVQGTLNQKPEYFNPARGESNFDFSLNEYPEIEPDVPFADYLHRNTKAEELLNCGDTVYFSVSSKDFEQYIRKNKALDFNEKHFNHGLVPIYTLRDKKEINLALYQYNNLEKKDEAYAPFIGIIFILMAIWILTAIWQNQLITYFDNKGFHRISRILKFINQKK